VGPTSSSTTGIGINLLGILLFARYDGARYTLVGVNVGDTDQRVPFWFPVAGDYVEELHSGALDLKNIPALQQVWLNTLALWSNLDPERVKTPRHYGTLRPLISLSWHEGYLPLASIHESTAAYVRGGIISVVCGCRHLRRKEQSSLSPATCAPLQTWPQPSPASSGRWSHRPLSQRGNVSRPCEFAKRDPAHQLGVGKSMRPYHELA
jgi:hypothetical protein